MWSNQIELSPLKHIGILAALGIPFQPLPDYQEGAEQALATAKQYMDNAKGPYGLLVKRQTFLPYKLKKGAPKK